MDLKFQKIFNTDGKGVTFKLEVKSLEACHINVFVLDLDYFHTVYYEKKDIATKEGQVFTYKITIPRSFDRTSILVYSNGRIAVTEVSAKEFKRDLSILNKQDREFVDLIEDFAYNSGYMPGNAVYKSKQGNFEIRYINGRLADGGIPVETPSRISVDHNFIEFSEEKNRKLTVPRRIAIGLHEYSHNFKSVNPDSEIEADTNAWKIYRKLGYPRIEFIKAWCNVFNGSLPKEIKTHSDEMKEQFYKKRILNIYNLIK